MRRTHPVAGDGAKPGERASPAGGAGGGRAGRWAKIALSLGVSAVFAWWSLRGKDLRGAWDAVSEAEAVWLLPFVGTMALIYLCRTMRWGLLLRPQLHLPFWRLNRVSAVGIMALQVLPLRLGEVARPLLVSGQGAGRTPFSKAFATIVVERVVDGLTVAAILFVALVFVEPRGVDQAAAVAAIRVSGYLVAASFGTLLALCVLTARYRDATSGALAATVGRIAPGPTRRLLHLLDTFVQGLAALPRGADVAKVLLYTAAYWGVNAVGIVCFARVFSIELTLVQGFTVLAVLVVALMIPAGPANVGTFQAGVQLALMLFVAPEVAQREGVACANVLWLTNNLFMIGLGLIFLAAGGADEVSLRDLMRRAQEVRGGLETSDAAIPREGPRRR